ncbi:TIGR02679 family protein [Tissierella creatinini]|nr:TIGR02679 family protein [Tissierella creatinini]TJX63104.1 TIGR02679 family protein [Soehngenia saccharolytica]
MMEKECVDYFKTNPGFRRLFEGLKEKYRSLGNLGGLVKLNNITETEKEALSGLFRKDYYSKKSATIKVDLIYKALEGTKFQGVDLEKVVRGYFKGDLISKKEERNSHNSQKALFFEKIILDFNGTKAFHWLDYLLKNKANAYRLLSQNYERDKANLRNKLVLVMKALNKLSFDSSNLTRLALFSSNISRNPHTFDDNTLAGNLLIYGIIYFLEMDYPQSAEDRAEVLYRAGLIKDEISNYTTINGFVAYKDGEVHKGWHGFYQNNEPVNINLWNLSEIDTLSTPFKSIFIFENPTVFSQVLEVLKDKKPSLVCTYGQLKLASLVFLDKLAANVDKIYYSGDFDPEGLQIADKLKTRYEEKLILWRFSKEEYDSIKSTKVIEGERMKKLDKIKSPHLQSLADHIREEGFAGYQELLTQMYIEDIEKIICILSSKYMV